MEEIIKVENLCFEYEPGLQTISNISFQIHKGEYVAILGHNGSGKSTIARAFEKAKGVAACDIQSAILLDDQENPIPFNPDEEQQIFIFNEEYIQKNVKLKEDGLNTVVMLGPQGDLENQIAIAKSKFDQSYSKSKAQQDEYDKYNDTTSVLSPNYFLKQMNLALSGDSHWAGRERLILKQRRNASVNDTTYESIISSRPDLSEVEVLKKYQEKDSLLEQARTGNARIIQEVPSKIYISNSENQIVELLKKEIEKPELSEREEYLFTLVQSGKLEEMDNIFSNSSVDHCPFCLQTINENYKKELTASIKKVLSQEVEEHKKALSKLIISPIEINLEPFSKLNQEILDTIIIALNSLNETIEFCNIDIKKKIENPFLKIEEKTYNLQGKLQLLCERLNLLEEDRVRYNKPFDDITKLEQELQLLNKQRAYYEIFSSYNNFTKQSQIKEQEMQKLKTLIENANIEKRTLDMLINQRKSIHIAVDIINRNLQYIFFAKNRLSIKVDNNIYSLLSDNRLVKPDNISIGERNIIALCYFFVDIFKNLNVKEVYNKEIFVVIDDPISSFDFENKVGMMSFLRAQIHRIMCGNPNSKLMILTHDLSAVFNIEKAFAEVRDTVKIKAGVDCNYCLLELDKKQLIDFRYKKRHEYNELLKAIFNYAQTGSSDYEIIIGNIMRRALETFSTFVYRKGIDTISYDDQILNKLEADYKFYFQNLMYRLVLNGESHMEERTRTLIDIDFTSILSASEKQRTARDILCFMYLLNSSHINAHLKEVEDAENEIQSWCNAIKEFHNEQ